MYKNEENPRINHNSSTLSTRQQRYNLRVKTQSPRNHRVLRNFNERLCFLERENTGNRYPRMVSVHRGGRDVLIGGELLERPAAPSPTLPPPSQRHIPPPRAILLSPLSQFAFPAKASSRRWLDDGVANVINSAPT